MFISNWSNEPVEIIKEKNICQFESQLCCIISFFLKVEVYMYIASCQLRLHVEKSPISYILVSFSFTHAHTHK